jgi:penicillin-binding protein 2
MIQSPEDRRPPLTPQLALRAAILGGIALAMFAIIFFRLWFLQVLSGDQFLAQASQNRVRDIAIAAQRGEIWDRNGNVLVSSRRAIAVQISPTDLPKSPAKQAVVYRRLGRVLGMSEKRHRCPIAGKLTRRLPPIPCDVAQQLALLPYVNVTIKTDVAPQVQFYLAERQDEFPGVEVQQIYLRNYPLHTLAAQLFGTIGPINPTEVKERQFRGVSRNAIIGQSGLESSYDRYLRGKNGVEQVQVDALGRLTGTQSSKPPVAGHTLKLSLDVNLQRAGQQALTQAIADNPPATAGAFVALSPTSGDVYAMGSLPTFNPNVFAKAISASAYRRLNNPASNFPLIDRAVQSAYPTGSAFKPITATAALQSKAWTVDQTFDDTGVFNIGAEHLHNSGHAVDGVLTLTDALRVSSDDFFYNLGARTNVANPAAQPGGGALQHWASQYGIGRSTGIDLGGEATGTLPSPRWREHIDHVERECELGTGPYKGHGRHTSCGIADGRPWSIGDNVNLAVGQGDVQVTPLQLAVAYAAIANGGKIVRPHIGSAVVNPDGTVLQKINPPPARFIQADPFYLETIRQGLREAASQPGGTSADVFSHFAEQVYGKTGTAQRNGQADQSWYACFVPATASSKPIVVVVTVEQGGFGAAAAAPAARQILSQWFFNKRGPFVVGTSKTL